MKKNLSKLEPMKTHYKKPLEVKNNTHYFEPTKTKVKNTFVNPRTFWARKNKMEGYENRLYWEWRYCTENNGQTFYYTLTYNNKNIPKYDGKNCFDYEDLRGLLNGGFTKNLLRNYGTKMKYFVGAELGEGKGTRGTNNNPHYHILFFLRSAERPEYPYTKITPYGFRNLIRKYWQGIDQDEEGYKNYKDFKKGIVKEGENLGLVTDYRAVLYCAKYVTKDIGLIQRESKIEERLRKEWRKDIYTCEESYRKFWNEEIVKKFNIPDKCQTTEEKTYQWTDKELSKILGVQELGNIKYENEIELCVAAIDKLNWYEKFRNKCKEYLDEKIKAEISRFRNRYCNKCRISQGVGEYALKGLKNDLKPKIGIYTATGYKEREMNLFYYRKLYCDVVKDALGNNKYILNEKGIEYNLNNLETKLKKLEEDTLKNLAVLDEKLANEILNSDINTKCTLNWDNIKTFLKYDEKREIARRYSQFKLVYEGRYYKMDTNGHRKIDVFNDFRYFIKPEYNNTKYDINPISNFLENLGEGYMAYNAHPYFLQDMQFYYLFDTISDYLFIQKDNAEEKKNNELKKTRQFHKNKEFNNYLLTQKFKL